MGVKDNKNEQITLLSRRSLLLTVAATTFALNQCFVADLTASFSAGPPQAKIRTFEVKKHNFPLSNYELFEILQDAVKEGLNVHVTEGSVSELLVVTAPVGSGMRGIQQRGELVIVKYVGN